MPLTGTYTRTLDEKGRLALPKQLRDDLTNGDHSVYVTPEPEGVVGIYSETEFHAKADRLSETSADPVDTRRFMRVYYSHAERVTPDAQGRIRVPDRLAERAGLTGEVVVLGVGDHAEVWDAAAWTQSLEGLQEQFDDLANRTAART